MYFYVFDLRNSQIRYYKFFDQQIAQMQEDKIMDIISNSFYRYVQNDKSNHNYDFSFAALSDKDLERVAVQIRSNQEKYKEDEQIELGIYLPSNRITNEFRFNECKWDNLTELNLIQNHIGDRGCKYIAQSNWKKLTEIELANNSIGEAGLRHLSKAQWQFLNRLNLKLIWRWRLQRAEQGQLEKTKGVVAWNDLRAKDCKELSKLQLPKSQLSLFENSIEKSGYRYLRHKNWQIRCDSKYRKK